MSARLKRPHAKLLFVLFVLGVGGFSLRFLTSHEPVYQSRKLTEWLADFGYSSDSHSEAEVARNKRAEQAVRQIGVEAIPLLLKQLQLKHSPFKTKVITWVNKQ